MESVIRRWGNSLAIRIPRSVAAEAGVEEGSPVEIGVDEGSIVVRPATAVTYDLKALLRKVSKANLHGEVATGRKRGREEW